MHSRRFTMQGDIMKILVCIRVGPDGEISSFDECALELALSTNNAEVSLLSMGPKSCENTLLSLTRLGAKTAYLLCDNAFAGSDTLATAYTLALAVKKINPNFVFCGRQSLIGDTAQTPIMLAQKINFNLITNVMSVESISNNDISCKTRDEGTQTVKTPALITIERINTLRKPSIRSTLGELKILNANDINANLQKCGLLGSPTRVIETKENQSGKRKCKFIEQNELEKVIQTALNKTKRITATKQSENKLKKVLCITNSPVDYAKKIADNIAVFDKLDVDSIISQISLQKPDAVLFGSDSISKRIASLTAAKMILGLCADCTDLQTDSNTLYMIRPALSGSVIAKIKSNTKPAMATVRTTENSNNIVVSAGFGVKDCIDDVKSFAKKLGASLNTSRKCVDNGILPYDIQVGLTGKKISPNVYIAVGISGAVQHIVGMEKSGTVIAINPDKNAPIFDYADYGILAEFTSDFLNIF